MKYVIVQKAALELEREIAYSKSHWGAMHAKKYRRELLTKVRKIAENPFMYSINEDFGENLRSADYKGNRIIYSVHNNTVFILGFPSIYKNT